MHMMQKIVNIRNISGEMQRKSWIVRRYEETRFSYTRLFIQVLMCPKIAFVLFVGNQHEWYIVFLVLDRMIVSVVLA